MRLTALALVILTLGSPVANGQPSAPVVTKTDVIYGRVEGSALLATDADPSKADRGFDVRLAGVLEYDPGKRAFTRSETCPSDTVVPTEGFRSRRIRSPSFSPTALSPSP